MTEELKDVEANIQDEEGGGRGSFKELESEMISEEAKFLEKKHALVDLQALKTVVSTFWDAAKGVQDKIRSQS